MRLQFTLLLVLSFILLSSLSYIFAHVEQVFYQTEKVKSLIPSDAAQLQLSNSVHKAVTLQWKLAVEKLPKTKLCYIIKEKKFESIQDAYDAVVSNVILRCGDEVSTAAVEFLNKQLAQIIGQPAQMNIKSIKNIEYIYFTVRTVSLLRKDLKDTVSAHGKELKGLFDKTTQLLTSADAANAEDEIHGYLYEILVMLKSLLPQDASSSASDALVSAYRIAQQRVESILASQGSSSQSIRQYGVFLRGVSKLTQNFGAKKIGKDELERLAVRLLASQQNIKSLDDAYYLVEGLSAPSSAKINLIYISPKVERRDNTQFVLKVSSVLGYALPAETQVVLKSLKKKGAAVADVADKVLAALDDNKTIYTLYSSSNVADVGLLQFSIDVKQQDAVLESVYRSISASSGATIDVKNFKIAVKVATTGQELESHAVQSVQQSLYRVLEVADAEKKRLSVSFTLDVSGSASSQVLHPHQVFLRMYNAAADQEAVFVVKKAIGNAYKSELLLSQVANEMFDHVSGKYSLYLIIGDASLEKPLLWEIGSANILFNTQKQQNEEEVLYAPRKLIEHKFREQDKRARAEISTLFSGIVIALLAVFIIALVTFVLPSLSNWPSGINALFGLIFNGLVVAMLLVIVMFWLKFDIFDTLLYLVVLGVLAAVFGSQALHSLAKKHTAAASDASN